jgi:peptidoglycan-associated lipoprotein
MNRSATLRMVLGLALALALAATGCSKKAAEEPPATTPPPAEPPVEQPQTPPETPTTPPETPAETAISWQDAFFDYDKSDLRDDARAALDADGKLLRDNANARVTIEGHCDERGTPEYNLALGERRAAAARDYLVAAGIDAGRVEIISYGEERPFATGSDESAWAQNRRAHFVSR